MRIEIKHLSFSYGKQPVLEDVNFSASDGQLISLLGPNGVGKTTLFRCMLGFLQPQQGSLFLDNKNIREISAKEKSGYIAYIPQSFNPAFNISVMDSVLMGANREVPMFGVPSKDLKIKALGILESLGIAHLADQGVMKISGGERQLMLLARAIMQDAKILIMDEPTANLDYGNNFKVMQTLQSLKERGYTIIFSTHDPQLALRYSDRILALKNGKIFVDGKPSEVANSTIFAKLYSINVAVNSVYVNDVEYKVCTPYE